VKAIFQSFQTVNATSRSLPVLETVCDDNFVLLHFHLTAPLVGSETIAVLALRHEVIERARGVARQRRVVLLAAANKFFAGLHFKTASVGHLVARNISLQLTHAQNSG
jgi:hypothetical protein